MVTKNTFAYWRKGQITHISWSRKEKIFSSQNTRSKVFWYSILLHNCNGALECIQTFMNQKAKHINYFVKS